MWYAGGIAAIRNELWEQSIPGLALLAFTLTPLVLTPIVSFRPESEKGSRVFRWFHRNFKSLSEGLTIGGLSYIPINAIAHHFDGSELSLAAKIAVPIAALGTGSGIAIVKRLIQNGKESCLNDEWKFVKALKATANKTARVLEYVIAPAGLIQLLKTARVTHTHLNAPDTYAPLLSDTNTLIVFGGLGAIGIINEVGLSRISEKLSFGLRCFFVDVGKGLSSTCFLTNQTLMLDALSKEHHHIGVGDVAGAAAGWSVTTLGPSIAINISESVKERKNQSQQINPENEPLVPKEKSEDDGLVIWQANCCSKKNKVDDKTAYKLVAVQNFFTKGGDDNNNNILEDIPKQNDDFYLLIEESHQDTESSEKTNSI